MNRIGHLVAVCVLLGATVAEVHAGVGGATTAVWPATAAVGSTFQATVTPVNFSTPPNDTENVVITSLFVTPACAESISPVCLPGDRDPGVFDVLKAVGDASTPPCAGITFTVGSPDLATGEVQLIPSSTITLGPSNGPLAARRCQVDLSIFVNKLPSNPVGGTPGLTDVLARLTLQGATSGINGTASSSAQITITSEPVPPPSPNVPTLSGGMMSVLTVLLILAGARVLRRRPV